MVSFAIVLENILPNILCFLVFLLIYIANFCSKRTIHLLQAIFL